MAAVAPPCLDSDPRLTDSQTDNPSSDYYEKPLQRGLCRDESGALRVRPDIEAKLRPETKRTADFLLFEHNTAAANAVVGCGNLVKVREQCSFGHVAHVASIFCDKLFLCDRCATPKARVRMFRYEHPYIYQHLMSTAFSVLTFTIKHDSAADGAESRIRMDNAKELFQAFYEKVDVKSGWYFFPAFQADADRRFTYTKFFAIHAHSPRELLIRKLPGWPTLDAAWKSIAGSSAEIRIRLFDGKGEDKQLEGLKLALSGFVDYYKAIGNDTARLVEFAKAFAKYPSSTPYGFFRGFDGREETLRVQHALKDHKENPQEVDLDEDGEEHHHPTFCEDCGKPMMKTPDSALTTVEDLAHKGFRVLFGHSDKPTYGRCSGDRGRPILHSSLEGASPPS